MGTASATAGIVVGLAALYVGPATTVAYCAGWQESFVVDGLLSVQAGSAEFADETRAAEAIVLFAQGLFGIYALGFWFGPFTCATQLV